MNSLSVLLYLIDVLASTAVLLGGALIVLAVGVALLWLGAAIRLDDMGRDEGLKQAVRDSRNKHTVQAAIVALILSLLLVAVPSKSTMYAIAASEAGQRIAQTEMVSGLADDATKAVRQWIQRQITTEEKHK